VNPDDLLAEVVHRLDTAGIAHMVAGSLSSSFHGEPRSTQDIDLVIDPDATSLAMFTAGWDRPRFYVGDGPTALRNRSQFNIIDTTTGWKIDLILRKDRAFSRAEFARRRPVDILGVATFIATAEDTILAKLEWAGQGGSERQLADVVSILRTVADDLDDDHLDRWAGELGVTTILERARAAATLRP